MEGLGLSSEVRAKGAAWALGSGRVIAEALEGSGARWPGRGQKRARMCFFAFWQNSDF